MLMGLNSGKGLQRKSDEQVLLNALARSYSPVPPTFKLFSAASGHLYVTNRRLIWRRLWFNVPIWGPHSFEVPLGEIEGVRVHGSTLAVTSNRGEYRFLLLRQRLWPPMFWYSKRVAQEWLPVIERALDGPLRSPPDKA